MVQKYGKGRVIEVILPFFLYIPSMLDREQVSWTKFEIKLLYTCDQRNGRSYTSSNFLEKLKILLYNNMLLDFYEPNTIFFSYLLLQLLTTTVIQVII